MKRKGLTLDEAFKLLDLYESAEEVHELIKSENCPAALKQDGSAYSDDYDDLFDEEQNQIVEELKDAGSIEEFNKRRKARHDTLKEAKEAHTEPEIGDIALLKIKLTDTSNLDHKNVYNGCERRPILIINIKTDVVDGVEITHSPTFKGMNLIPVGHLSDNRESYANIYNLYKYKDLPISYEFPAGFNKETHKPLTQAEYFSFAAIRKTKDADEPFIIDFDYSDNYKMQLPEDKVKQVLNAIKENKK